MIDKVSRQERKILRVLIPYFIHSFNKPLNQVPGLPKVYSGRDKQLNKQIQYTVANAHEGCTVGAEKKSRPIFGDQVGSASHRWRQGPRPKNGDI